MRVQLAGRLAVAVAVAAVTAACSGAESPGDRAEVSTGSTGASAPDTATTAGPSQSPDETVILDPPCPPPERFLALAGAPGGRITAGPQCAGPWAAALLTGARPGVTRVVLRRYGFEYRVLELTAGAAPCGRRVAALPERLRSLVGCPR